MFSRLSIKSQLWIFVLIAAVFMIAVCGTGVYAARQGSAALEKEHIHSLQPMVLLDKIMTLTQETRFRMAGVLLDQMPNEGAKNHATSSAKEVPQLWGQYLKLTQDANAGDSEKSAVRAKADAGIKKLSAFYEKLIQAYQKGDRKELSTMLEDEWPAVHMAFVKPMENLVPLEEKNSLKTYEASSALLQRLTLQVLAISACSVFVLAALAIFLNRGVSQSLSEASNVVSRVAQGDLSVHIDTKRAGEVGKLLVAMHSMVANLSRLVENVRDSTNTIHTASGEIASGNAELSHRTESQASALEETASSMEELTSTVQQNADNAQQANRLVEATAEVALKGGQIVESVVTTMGKIKEQSRKISDIIGVIDGIAFQTNLLALNAAVEAARAGEQGRGFAVVAAEVRNLAHRSATAAKEIKGLIGNSVDKIEVGDTLVNNAGRTMQEIVASVKRVKDIMAEISSASQEQSTGLAEINHSVTQMDEMTQQNAALVEQAAAAAATMQDQAKTLSEGVSRFKL